MDQVRWLASVFVCGGAGGLLRVYPAPCFLAHGLRRSQRRQLALHVTRDRTWSSSGT